MNQQTVYAIIFLGIFLLLIGISQALYKFLNVSSEQSRKFLHVSGGILALFAPLFIKSHWIVLILCSLAFLLLLLTYIKHWLPAVHATRRRSIGSVIFPIPLYLCFYVALSKNDYLLFYLPISFLTISDALAEWAGKKWEDRSMKLMWGQKTVAGSIAFGLSAILISIVWGLVYNLCSEQIIEMSLVASLIATGSELVTTKGWDNLTVPLATTICLLALQHH